MYQEDQIKSKHAVRTWQINNVSLLRAYIQSRDSIYGVERNFSVSVYGADPIAEVKLLVSPFLRWPLDYEINYWVFKKFELTCNHLYIINN
jgi:hypothetical protein